MKYMILVSLCVASVASAADVSPLCTDLAKFACAPGTYKDGTGEVKSEDDIHDSLQKYAEKSKVALRDKFQKLLNDPKGDYFKDVSLSALGLKDSPQCTSKSNEDIADCKKNLLNALTVLAQKQALGPLYSRTGLERIGNMKDLMWITNNVSYLKILKEFNDQVGKDLGGGPEQKKIEDKIFPDIKALVIARVKKFPMDETQKNLMIKKIKAIEFDGADCSEMNSSPYASQDQVSKLLIPNAFYSPLKNIFKYCGGYAIQSNSAFQMASTIAHELAHSIDPCNISMGPDTMAFKYSNPKDLKKMESEYPIKNLISCLRDKKSAEAVNYSGTTPPQPYGNYPLPTGMAVPTQTSSTQMVPNDPNFCFQDQIGESFADWMAAEVTPQYIESNYKLSQDQYRNGYANAFRVGCSQMDAASENGIRDTHPRFAKRINGIILVNPKVRAQMNCPAKHPDNIYCDPENPSASATGGTATPPGGTNPQGGVR